MSNVNDVGAVIEAILLLSCGSHKTTSTAADKATIESQQEELSFYFRYRASGSDNANMTSTHA